MTKALRKAIMHRSKLKNILNLGCHNWKEDQKQKRLGLTEHSSIYL